MAVVYFNGKPARQVFERVTAEMGLDHLRQQSGVERAWQHPRQVGALAFTLEHREIEAERVPNQDGA